MKVSIITPVYNIEKYIKRCLESLINQTYKDIEIIVVDNGSTDNSNNIVKDLMSSDNRIKLIECKVKGASATRNKGLDIATGDYGLFVDSDDYVSEDYVEKMIAKVEKNKSTMVLCNNYELWKDSTDDRKLFKNINNKTLDKLTVIKEIASGAAGLVCGKLFDLNIIRENKIEFDSNIKLSEDLLFFLDVAKYTNIFIHIDESLYFYDRRNENSITRRYLENAWENQMYVLNKTEQILSECDINYEDKEIILCNKLKNAISFSINNEVENINFKNYKDKLKKIKEILDKKINMEKIRKIGYNSFQERFIISGLKTFSKSMWIAQLLFIFKVLIPIKHKISTIR